MRATTWDTEWAALKPSDALRYLGDFYPECAASEALHSHQDAAYEAAVSGDREKYLEALRSFMKAGRDEALRIRKEAA